MLHDIFNWSNDKLVKCRQCDPPSLITRFSEIYFGKPDPPAERLQYRVRSKIPRTHFQVDFEFEMK